MDLNPAAAAGPHLPTWTRTLNTSDALDLLDMAQPGMPLSDWKERAHAMLPQASRARRQELVREVQRDLLDHDGEVVQGSTFLRLFHHEAPHVREALFIGRLLSTRAGIAEVLDELIHPAILRAEEPLALPEDAHVNGETWAAWLRRHLPPGTGTPAQEKTRQTLQRHLAIAGVLVLDEPPGTGGTAQRSRPPPLAFTWLVAAEMARDHRAEASVSWALGASFAARLFAVDEPYGRAALEIGVQAGLLRRGYLAGIPRLHVGELGA
jgi:hypothetical protein